MPWAWTADRAAFPPKTRRIN